MPQVWSALRSHVPSGTGRQQVITLGYKDNITSQQIKTYTEMDSHEEKLQKIIMEVRLNAINQPDITSAHLSPDVHLIAYTEQSQRGPGGSPQESRND